MTIANLALRFFLELGGAAAVGYSAYQLAGSGAGPMRWLAAIGASLALIILWALVVAPRTANGLSQPQKDVIGTVVLILAAASLAIAGQLPAAIGFGVVVVVNEALLFVFGNEADMRLTGVAS